MCLSHVLFLSFFLAPRLKPGTVLCLSVVGTSCLTLVFPPDEEECDAMSLFNTKKGKRIKFCSCFVSLSFIPAGLRLGLIGRLSAFWLLAAQRKSLRQRRLDLKTILCYYLHSDTQAFSVFFMHFFLLLQGMGLNGCMFTQGHYKYIIIIISY